uniref:Uncharacterized protein n=1 Tax=Anopheles darlingi TaxID=43151 RepID=A0A2M4D165_ANODA
MPLLIPVTVTVTVSVPLTLTLALPLTISFAFSLALPVTITAAFPVAVTTLPVTVPFTGFTISLAGSTAIASSTSGRFLHRRRPSPVML